MTTEDSGPPAVRGLIRNPRDFWSGLVFVALAGFAFWATRNLGGMQGFSFGSGTAPWLFAGLLAALGTTVVVTALLKDGPPLPYYAVRGPIFVFAATLIFAFTIRPFGLVIASILTFSAASMASRETRPVEAAIFAVVMSAFNVGLFVFLLKLNFPVWPVLS